MIIERAFAILMLSLGLFFSGATGTQLVLANNCEELIFSDVRHVPEADDYLGTELIFRICTNTTQVTGEWKEYEGWHPASTKLIGYFSENRMWLTGQNSEGKVEFEGGLSGKHLNGKLLWYIGATLQVEEINLERTENPVRPPQ
jgi:hypothetical protein